MSLYNLTSAYDELLNKLYDDEMDEDALIECLNGIEEAIEAKADNTAFVIAELQKDINFIADEQKRLNARKKSLERNVETLKKNLFNAMKTVGKTKFKTALHSFSISSNGGKLPLVLLANEDEIPQEFKKVTYILDNDKIREAIDSGECSFAKYGERGESLRIK